MKYVDIENLIGKTVEVVDGSIGVVIGVHLYVNKNGINSVLVSILGGLSNYYLYNEITVIKE